MHVDGRRDCLILGHHSHELHLELAVREELLAPRVEQHAVRRPGDLEPLCDQAGEAQLPGGLGIGMEVAAT